MMKTWLWNNCCKTCVCWGGGGGACLPFCVAAMERGVGGVRRVIKKKFKQMFIGNNWWLNKSKWKGQLSFCTLFGTTDVIVGLLFIKHASLHYNIDILSLIHTFSRGSIPVSNCAFCQIERKGLRELKQNCRLKTATKTIILVKVKQSKYQENEVEFKVWHPLGQRRKDTWCPSSVWNLRAVIWFPFPISYLVFSAMSSYFFCFVVFLLMVHSPGFYQKKSNIFH